MSEEIKNEREHFFGAAKVMAGLTLLSRVMGMFKAMAIASLGAVGANDAFSLAFRIPNLFRRLFGEGALSSAFVPIFSETLEKQGHEQADRLLSNAVSLLTIFLLAMLVLMLAGLFGWLIVDPRQQLLVGLAATMLPFMLTVCVLALCSAALNCRGHFAYPAATPIILNIAIVAAAWLVAPQFRGDLAGQLYIISGSVTVAGFLQLLPVFWLLRNKGFHLRLRLLPLEPGIKQMLRTMAPMVLGLGLLQFTELLESGVAYFLRATPACSTMSIFGQTIALPLKEGVLARVDAARYLYQFPLGVLANSLAVAVFPLLSRYGARGDMVNLRDSVNRAFRLAMMEGMAAGVGLFLLAEPITSLLYQRGSFTAADSSHAAFILQMYVLGMWAYCTYQIQVRAFYSLKDSMTPLKVSCSLMAVELVLILTLIWVPQLGAAAFGLTTAVVFSLNTLILSLLLRRRIGLIGGRKLLISAARSAAACAAMAAVIFTLQHVLLAGRPAWQIVAVSVPAGGAIFVAAVWLLRAPELGEMVGALKHRRKKSDEPAPQQAAQAPARPVAASAAAVGADVKKDRT